MERHYSKFYLKLRDVLTRSDSFKKLIEQLEANSPNPEFSLYLFVGILILPIFPAVILTILHVYPATIGFKLCKTLFGGYSLKIAMLINIALFMVVALVISLPLLIANRINYERHKRSAAQK